MRDDFTLDAAATEALRIEMRGKSVRAPPSETSATSRS
jgi:hypothetical protein